MRIKSLYMDQRNLNTVSLKLGLFCEIRETSISKDIGIMTFCTSVILQLCT
jgi:hypothetical protein